MKRKPVVKKRRTPVKISDAKLEERRQKSREYHLMRTYGITMEQYDELLEKQDHKCAICQKHENQFKRKLHVDHDHHTGEVRGLLCYHCNNKVVGRQRDPAVVWRLYQYLQNKTGWFVPKKTKKTRKKRR